MNLSVFLIKAAASLGIFATLSLVAAAPANAQQDRPRAVSGSGPVTLDPTRGYIMAEAGGAFILAFFRVPDEQERANFRQRRVAALALERGRYVRRIRAWTLNQASYNDCRQTRPANLCPGGTSPRPIEPTEGNFELPPLELATLFNIGLQNRLVREEGRSVYLSSVRPGRYALYGVFALAQPAGGLCFCFGTVAFDVRAGGITDLGVFAAISNETSLTSTDIGGVGVVGLIPADRSRLPIDVRLSGVTVTPVQFEAVGKLPNYYALTIDRIAALPGVIGYDRDRVQNGAGTDITDEYLGLLRQTTPPIPVALAPNR